MTSEELKELEATLWKSADTLRASSDFPMILTECKHYPDLFRKFLDSFKKKSINNKKYNRGNGVSLPVNVNEFMENIIDKNPRKFLFDI
tara:strand:+ start:23445 stop:23711 length:267 start_codon:yes stop_codon:yes gene_type:complete